jgi:hypothetical protein
MGRTAEAVVEVAEDGQRSEVMDSSHMIVDIFASDVVRIF